ncbi:MAG: FtsX-like permease family protein, partial [Balneolaceae bacterium]
VFSYGGDPLFRADTLQTFVRNIEYVKNAKPIVLGQVMIQSERDVSGTMLKGVESGKSLTDIPSYLTQGKYSFEPNDDGLPGIILGSKLARTIGAEIGSKVTVYTIDGLPSPFNSPEIKQFHTSAIYQTGIDRFDDNFAMTEIQYTRELFRIGRIQATALEIMAEDNAHITAVYTAVRDQTSFPYVTENIFQRHRNIFAWVDLQEETIPFVISVMVIVAAFNLIGAILMMVLERIRDIGILKTIGAKNKSIRRIFLMEGLFVATIGLIIGIGISIFFNWAQGSYRIIPLAEENYYMSYVPVEPHMLDFFIVAAVTFFLCTLASWLPARTAAKTDPVQVLSFSK